MRAFVGGARDPDALDKKRRPARGGGEWRRSVRCSAFAGEPVFHARLPVRHARAHSTRSAISSACPRLSGVSNRTAGPLRHGKRIPGRRHPRLRRRRARDGEKGCRNGDKTLTKLVVVSWWLTTVVIAQSSGAAGRREGAGIDTQRSIPVSCPVSEEDGRFMRVLVIANGSKRGLEIGATYGYSAIWIGLGLQNRPADISRRSSTMLPRAKAAADNIRRAGLSRHGDGRARRCVQGNRESARARSTSCSRRLENLTTRSFSILCFHG